MLCFYTNKESQIKVFSWCTLLYLNILTIFRELFPVVNAFKKSGNNYKVKIGLFFPPNDNTNTESLFA